ncbi:MAG TPA: isocitrate lyase/phosphoenolpyruvate mutase family protein [Allosphingosinicella sp.]|nr:isocitrate lyase/phosphoenolpyruvate mutase family protein [Allosphingosinicella sp.]
MSGKFETFAALHVPGDPLILYNIWDPGSARIVAEAGARAIATGSASVAASQGFADGEQLPLEVALANARAIVASVDLPVTIDFEGGYAVESEPMAANLRRLLETGAVGCNLEDQIVGGDGLHPTDRQVERLRAVRAAVGPDFFVNARTDLFLKARREDHDQAMVEAALARADAYAEAGASGIFVPGLADPRLLEHFCTASPLPVNFMAFPGGPETKEIAAAGVARISHGPFPYKLTMSAFRQAAQAAYRP